MDKNAHTPRVSFPPKWHWLNEWHDLSIHRKLQHVAMIVGVIFIVAVLTIQLKPIITHRLDLASSDPETAASAKLTTQVTSDSADVQQHLMNLWTAQISAKYVGLAWQGQTWTYQDIWNDFISYQNEFPVKLIRGDVDASLNHNGNWYVTVAYPGFSSESAAEKWCTDNHFVLGDTCLAAKITKAPGYAGYDFIPLLTILSFFIGIGGCIIGIIPIIKERRKRQSIAIQINQSETEIDISDEHQET